MVPEQATSRRPRRPAEETRSAILEAAEPVFAEVGYAAARLEDVAERVGIRRASLVYHFRDKRALYRAVLESALGPLREQVRATLDTPGSAPARVEAVVAACAEYIGLRPASARLILREIADGDPRRIADLLEGCAPVLADWLALLRRAQGSAAAPADPLELTSMLIGACTFLYIATPYLDPTVPPSAPARRQAHADALRRWTRSLLASGGLRLVRDGRPALHRARRDT